MNRRVSEREEELLLASNQRELTLDELLELAQLPLEPVTVQDWKRMKYGRGGQ